MFNITGEPREINIKWFDKISANTWQIILNLEVLSGPVKKRFLF
jgi:hypothetical protein